MRVGDCAWSMQYHVEVEHDTVENWSKIPEYYSALQKSLGKDNIEELRIKSSELMTNFNDNCKRIFTNFFSTVDQYRNIHR